MAQLFREEEGYPDNRQRQNFIFLGYPFTPPLPLDDYRNVTSELQSEIPIRFWYFLDEVTTDEMMRKVWRAILRSDLAVFDVSGGNPNVAFELGLAVAKDRRSMTLLKSGAANPLGAADLGYAERMEYTSAATLRDRLRTFVTARSSAMVKLRELSYTVSPSDGSVTREETEKRLVAMTAKVFSSKAITKSGAKAIMGSDALATAALGALRSEGILEMEGARRGAKYRFAEDWVYHDHEVAGTA